jgi:AcrR family transcriptional regulator
MPVAGKTKQEVLSQFRCAEILEAARRIFAKKGFADATMDEIAAATGLAKGTLYLYFKSKRDVYLKTLQHGNTELLKHVETDMLAAAGPRAKIRALISTRVKYAEVNRDFYKIYLAVFSGISHPASINKEFRAFHLQQAQALEQVLRDGVGRGEIRQLDIAAAAFTIQDMARSLISRRLLGLSRKNVEEDIDFVCDLIWKGIGC